MSATLPETQPSAPAQPRPPGVPPERLEQWLYDGQEIALFDVREHGEYGEGHLFHAVPLPWSRLELELPRLAPCRATRVVLCDHAGAGPAASAWQRLRALGYANSFVLDSGVAGWSASGRRLFKGVNLPSKSFGELVEQRLHTPSISARELARRQAAGDDVLLLDGRSHAEFQKMSIPGAINCPNGELALRAAALAPCARSTIVVHCAGRTRSIIGAQTLINLGLPNPVLALENGTQGWFLADLPLEHGQQRRHGFALPPDLALRQRQARALAQRHGVQWIAAAQAQRWIDDAGRSSFVLDVRTPEEFAQGTLAGAQSAPGGQLLQATDQYLGVRGARLLLCDSEDVRAPVCASWLRQMGHDAHVLQGGIGAALHLPRALAPDLPELPLQSPEQLAAALAAASVLLLDLRAGMAFRRAHIPGARWAIRPQLHAGWFTGAAAGAALTLVADDPGVARLVAHDLLELGQPLPHLLAGGVAAWQQSGRALHSTPDWPDERHCIDHLFFVHDRHDGNKDAARRYLQWETALPAALDARDLASWRIA